tara:strand:- start:1649 stop:2014 length:366 start_codon:yes stop_codon:yes gene_type:complete
MKPNVKKILQKFSTEKIELARKPASILKDLQKLDSKLSKEETKIEKTYLQYKKAWNEWDALSNSAEKDFFKLTDDFGGVVKALNELDLRPHDVPEMVKGDEIITKLRSIVVNMKDLYPAPN